MRVAIFGAGPAGLLIAHACEQLRVEYTIFSDSDRPSQLHGAQYLHAPIPGIPDIPRVLLTHRITGSIEGYRRKVYGMDWTGEVSPEKYGGTEHAWDIRYTYDWLVERFWPKVQKARINGWRLEGHEAGFPTMRELNAQYGLIFSTIPRRILCVDPNHEFGYARVYTMGDAPDLGVHVPVQVNPNTLVCSGEREVSWYRACHIFGHVTVEWPTVGRRKPPISGVVEVQKPTRTNCTCWPEISYQGRYGQWRKGVLVHDAYRGAVLTLREKLSSSAAVLQVEQDSSPV